MNLQDKFGMSGAFHGCMYQHRRVLSALESGDPEELVWAMRQIKAGSMEGFERTDEFAFSNTVVNEYRNKVLQLGIGGGTVITNVRMGLFDNDVTPGRTTTLANMSATINEFTDYKLADDNTTNRAPYTGGTAASQSIDNTASPSRFVFEGTGTIYWLIIYLMD